VPKGGGEKNPPLNPLCGGVSPRGGLFWGGHTPPKFFSKNNIFLGGGENTHLGGAGAEFFPPRRRAASGKKKYRGAGSYFFFRAAQKQTLFFRGARADNHLIISEGDTFRLRIPTNPTQPHHFAHDEVQLFPSAALAKK